MKTYCIALAFIAVVTQGCTGITANRMFESSDSGFVMLAGDAEGIRAYNDGLNGLVTNTKSSPDIKSSYWQNRDSETQVRAIKFKPVKR